MKESQVKFLSRKGKVMEAYCFHLMKAGKNYQTNMNVFILLHRRHHLYIFWMIFLQKKMMNYIWHCHWFVYTSFWSFVLLFISFLIIVFFLQVNLALIDKFWAVKEYIRAIQKIPAEERDHWPMADSPRARKRRHL